MKAQEIDAHLSITLWNKECADIPAHEIVYDIRYEYACLYYDLNRINGISIHTGSRQRPDYGDL